MTPTKPPPPNSAVRKEMRMVCVKSDPVVVPSYG